MAGEAPPDVLATFYEFDEDGNGLIERSELVAILKKLGPDKFDDDSIASLFQDVDTNGDGKIDLEEFLKWMFDDPDAQAVREALDRQRMTQISSTLLAAPLAWMKQSVEKSAFDEGVLSLIRDHRVTANAGVDTLPMAHAMLSVGSNALPSELRIEDATGKALPDAQAAPLAYAALLSGCKTVKVGQVTWGERLTEALHHGLQTTQTTSLSLDFAGVSVEEDMATILAGIGDNARLQTLDLSGNVFGSDAMLELKEAVVGCQALKCVRLKSMVGNNDGGYLELLREVEALLRARDGALEHDAC